MTQRNEFRVRWKREGRQQTTRIYQSGKAAHRKAQGILGLEAVKADTSFHAMPDLEIAPVIEMRPVGDWEPTEYQVAEVSEGTKMSMADWAEYVHPRNPAAVGGDDGIF